MPSITLSSALTDCINSNLYNFNCCAQGNNSCNPQYLGANYPCTTMRYGSANCFAGATQFLAGLNIMQGALPTNVNTDLTLATSRNADLLMRFSSFSIFAVTSGLSTNPVTLTSLPITATATGTATWFWLSQTPYLPSGYTCTNYNRLWGTVGLQGSGADLEISSTNIVANNVYKIINLRLSVPQTYNY